MQKEIEFRKDTIRIYYAHSCKDIKERIKDIFADYEDMLPRKKNCPILIKPNLNNDLNSLTGNSTDLRIIAGVIEYLQLKGYSDISCVDGPNVGIDRRGIDVFKRLRIDKLAELYGIKIINLNNSLPASCSFPTGKIALSRDILNAGFLINIPKVKTHAEAMFSCSVKNLMGCVVGQQKRNMHKNLPLNLIRINEIVDPHITIVDGVIVMEGNGPGDGFPKKIGLIAAGKNRFLIDLVISKLFGFDWKDIEYLAFAYAAGHITDDDIARIKDIDTEYNIDKPPKRSRLAYLSESKYLYWLKVIVRPFTSLKFVSRIAYRLKIVQDIYSVDDDAVMQILFNPVKFRSFFDRCLCYCPTDFKAITNDMNSMRREDNIGYNLLSSSLCVGCLYCYLVCPEEAVELKGKKGFLELHLKKYRKEILELAGTDTS